MQVYSLRQFTSYISLLSCHTGHHRMGDLTTETFLEAHNQVASD